MTFLARASVGLVVLLALAGCGDDATGAAGQFGNLHFAYTCEGCELGHEILAGSELDLRVAGVSPHVRYEVRSTNGSLADFSSTARCTFVGQNDCHHGVHVVTKHAGDVDLEVIDAWTETVIDRVTLKVRDAARIDTTVRADGATLTPASTGAFELAVGSDVEILSVARGATGEALIASAGALHGTYADESVVEPVVESGAVHRARAKTPGATTVVVLARGAQHELPFVVR